MNHIINDRLAVRFGIKEALILHEIYSALLACKQADRPKYRGKYWYRASYRMISAELPMLSRGSAGRVLRRLVRLGILLRMECNESRFDRTASYTFTEFGEMLMKCSETNSECNIGEER